MRSRLYGAKGLLFCSHLKEHLREYLEAYIDAMRSKEVCTVVLTPGKAKPEAKGYRVILPEMKDKEDKEEGSKCRSRP